MVRFSDKASGERGNNSSQQPSDNNNVDTRIDAAPRRRGCGDSQLWLQISQSIAHVLAPRQRRRRIHQPVRSNRHLLRGCTTMEEHLECIRQALSVVEGKHGADGLAALGFSYQWVECESRPCTTTLSCRHCAQRLFYHETETEDGIRITDSNRKDYIADGKMYEAVCRLAQEYAQECLANVGDLEWQMVVEGNASDSDREDSAKTTTTSSNTPIRVLISRNDSKNQKERPLLVICTGRGKVRAGVFSRHHLLCTGLEIGSAFHLVQAATAAGYRVALFDPNVHGEAKGYDTFTKSMRHVELQHPTSNPPTDYLLHSASGGHFVRYLLEHGNSSNTGRRIAFTDSTHNIQWLQPHHPHLWDKLQHPRDVVYFRSSSTPAAPPSGTPCATDARWRHRFGQIRTLWAGTHDHALTNWSAHHEIWEHFVSTEGPEAVKND